MFCVNDFEGVKAKIFKRVKSNDFSKEFKVKISKESKSNGFKVIFKQKIEIWIMVLKLVMLFKKWLRKI